MKESEREGGNKEESEFVGTHNFCGMWRSCQGCLSVSACSLEVTLTMVVLFTPSVVCYNSK